MVQLPPSAQVFILHKKNLPVKSQVRPGPFSNLLMLQERTGVEACPEGGINYIAGVCYIKHFSNLRWITLKPNRKQLRLRLN
jgi:hypothetical protein